MFLLHIICIVYITHCDICLHQNLGEERGNSQASRIMPIKESMVDICWIECDTRSILSKWRQQMTMMGYDWRQEDTYRILQKGKE